MGREMFISILKCAITGRGSTVTKVRVRIALDACSDATVVLDEMLEVNIPDGEEQEISCAVPMLHVKSGQTVYVAVEANAICSFAHTNSEEHFAYDYATNGNMDKSMDAYAVEGGGRYRLWLVADGYAVENAAMLARLFCLYCLNFLSTLSDQRILPKLFFQSRNSRRQRRRNQLIDFTAAILQPLYFGRQHTSLCINV